MDIVTPKPLTLTKEELCDIKCKVENIFLELEQRFTERNKLGRKPRMNEGTELFAYTFLLRELTLPDNAFYQDDTYQSILSNRDVYRMYHRALQLESKIN